VSTPSKDQEMAERVREAKRALNETILDAMEHGLTVNVGLNQTNDMKLGLVTSVVVEIARPL